MNRSFIDEDTLMRKINDICPEMKSNVYLMMLARREFCGIHNPKIKQKSLTMKQIQLIHKLRHVINDMNIGDLIDYLKQNFKSDDKVCYMDCVQGVKNDCTYIRKSQLGDRFFKYGNLDGEKAVIMF